jgi:DegV family protein with EDD domain
LGVRVVCDTACDLPDRLVESLGILLVPLHVRFGGLELVDRVELSTQQFWQRCARSNEFPETAAPAPGAFQAAFELAARAGATEVACVTISSKLSATYDAACQAARTVDAGLTVQVVDSLSATLGEGLVALAAAEVAAQGAALPAVVAEAVSARDRLSVYGAIDTLENLRRGGRIGGAAAAVGALLSIKPVIEVRGGLVEEESKQRTRAKSLRYLAAKAASAGPLERFAVMGANAADFDEFLGLVSSVRAERPTVIGDIGPVIGAHAGRGAIGVAWVKAKSSGVRQPS